MTSTAVAARTLIPRVEKDNTVNNETKNKDPHNPIDITTPLQKKTTTK